MSRLYSSLVFLVLALVSEATKPGQGCPPSDKFVPCKCSDLSINCDRAKNTTGLAESFNQEFRDFGVFKAVIINNSEIQTLPSGIFKSIKSKLFYIVHCPQLSSIGENAFEGSEVTVETLILTNNAIDRESVFNAASNLKNLRHLHLFRNKILTVPDSALTNMENLQTINLQNNLISGIGTRAFFNLTSLQYLRLQKNRLTTIGDYAFAFGKARHPFSTNILLQGNDLEDFRPDSFKGLERKLTIDLRNNYITTLPQYVFEHLVNYFSSTGDRTSTIKVDGNEHKCDCNMKWILDREDEITYIPSVKCDDTGDYLSERKKSLADECGSLN